jgi:hypothetical protein
MVDGKEIEIYIQRPTNEVIKLADRYKSKIWNQAIQDEVLTKKELNVLMKSRGIWDEAKDKEEDDITKKVVDLERKLYHGDGKKKPKVSEGKEFAIEIRRQRIALRDLIADRISLEENTAESLADNARFDYLVATCTFYKDGTLVWKDFDEYNSQSGNEIAFASATTLGEILYNLDSSFEKNLPENIFLIKFGLVNKDLSLVDPVDGETLIDTEGNKIDNEGYLVNSDGERVDREGNKITDEGLYELAEYVNDLVPPKPKATRKKKTTKEAEKAPETSATES